MHWSGLGRLVVSVRQAGGEGASRGVLVGLREIRMYSIGRCRLQQFCRETLVLSALGVVLFEYGV